MGEIFATPLLNYSQEKEGNSCVLLVTIAYVKIPA